MGWNEGSEEDREQRIAGLVNGNDNPVAVQPEPNLVTHDHNRQHHLSSNTVLQELYFF
jgi:hypothetical protein